MRVTISFLVFLILNFAVAKGRTYSGFFYSRLILRSSWQPNHQDFFNSFQSDLACRTLCVKHSPNCSAYVVNDLESKCEWMSGPFEVIYVANDPNIDSIQVQIKPEAGVERIGIFGKQSDDKAIDKAFDYIPDDEDADPDLVLIPYKDFRKASPHIMKYHDGFMYCGGAKEWNVQSNKCFFTKIGRTSWDPMPSLPFKHGMGASTVVGGTPFLGGGLNGAYIIKKTHLFVNGSWMEGAPMPRGPFRHTMVAVSNDEALVLGMSKIPDFRAYADTLIYNKVANEWTPSGDLSLARTNIAAGLVEVGPGIQVVVAVGGQLPFSDLVEIFHVHNRTWSIAPHRFPYQVSNGCLAVVKRLTRLFHLGGLAANGTAMKAVHEYVHNGAWIRRHDMKEPMLDFGVLSYNNFFGA